MDLIGHIEKLKEPIELKGRVIKYKPIAKLIRKKSVKKGGMFPRSQGGPARVPAEVPANIESICIHDRNNEGGIETTLLRVFVDSNNWVRDGIGNSIFLDKYEKVKKLYELKNEKTGEVYFMIEKNNGINGYVKAKYIKCLNPEMKCTHDRQNADYIETTMLRLFPDEDKWAKYDGKPIVLEKDEEVIVIATNIKKNQQGEEYFYVIKNNNTNAGGLVKAKYIKCSNSRVQLPNISKSLLVSQHNLTNWTSSFQPSYGPSSQSAILPGLRGHSAILPGLRGHSATLPGSQLQPTNLSGFSGQSAILPRPKWQSASLSNFSGQPNRSTDQQ